MPNRSYTQEEYSRRHQPAPAASAEDVARSEARKELTELVSRVVRRCVKQFGKDEASDLEREANRTFGLGPNQDLSRYVRTAGDVAFIEARCMTALFKAIEERNVRISRIV